MKIKVLKDVKYNEQKIILHKDEIFTFEDDINILSGTNGTGKTTLLTALRMFDKSDINYLTQKQELNDCLELDNEYNFYSYFASEDDSQGIGMLDMNLYIQMGGIERQNHSQGESMLIGLSLLIQKIKKRTKRKCYNFIR